MYHAAFVLEHKAWVLYYCWRAGLWWAGIAHDLSKLRLDEWRAAARYHYGGPGGTRSLDPYDRRCYEQAMLRHAHRNPHHWQHWIQHFDDGRHVVWPMPARYRGEMVADWQAMARQAGVSVAAWWRAHRAGIRLHPATERQVEAFISRS